MKFLISKNVDLNVKAPCGTTALHFAADNGYCDIVTKLLEHGAEITKNDVGMNAFMTAAERTKSNVVEYFVNSGRFSKEEIVDAYELLGASFANDKENYSLSEAYKYLKMAMDLRYLDIL